MTDVMAKKESKDVFKRPPENSQLVEEAHADVSVTVDLNDMPSDLILVAKFLQVAENGLVAFPELQGKVKRSQIQILQLTDKSIVAMSDFARASSRVIDNLESTYYHLTHGNLKMAEKVYTSVSEEADNMVKKAQSLVDKYEQEVEKLKDILSETYDAQGAEEKKKRDAMSDKRKLTSDIKKLKALKGEAQKKFLELKSLFDEAKRKEHKELKKSGNPFKKLLNGISSKFIGAEIFDMGQHKDAAKAFREAKFKYFEEMEKVRDAKSTLIASIAEHTQHMANTDDVKKLADEAIESLKSVIGELHEIIAVFTKVALFWDEMKGHLEDLQKGNQLEHVITLEDEKERERVVKSEDFQSKAYKNMAKWMATYGMTKSFRKLMKPARDELANIVRGNLNKEESKENIKKISKELFAEEARRRKRIAMLKKDEL